MVFFAGYQSFRAAYGFQQFQGVDSLPPTAYLVDFVENWENAAKIEAQAPIFRSATLYFRDFYIKNYEFQSNFTFQLLLATK